MKKFICLVLALLTVVSVVACDTNPSNTPDSADSTNVSETNAPAIKVPAEPYDGVFQAGFSRIDITPSVPIKAKTGGSTYKKIADNLYLTCIAVYDGENTALFYTVDVTSIGDAECENMKKYANKASNVPVENIIISATHTHTSPVPGIPNSDPANMRWVLKINDAVATAAKEAIADLADAEIYNGTTVVEGMAFVRRGYFEDGAPAGIWRQNGYNNMARYESEADNSVQIIRFVRKDKKDIVMANLQTHFTEAGQYYKGNVPISADLGFILRTMVELEDEDALFAVYVGASGNIATVAHVDGTKKFGNYQKMGAAVAEAIVNSTDNLVKVEAGKIQASGKNITTKVRKDSADIVEKAIAAKAEIDALGGVADDNENAVAISYKYGFESVKEVKSVVSRNTEKGETRTQYISAISFGDLAFVAAPYEMFDTNGMEIKNGSPFNMTFVITNAGGAGAYVPSALAVPNGGYEVYTAVDEFGSAEMFVEAFLNILRSHKK